MASLVVFDDRAVVGSTRRGDGADFGPMADLRAVFEIRTGRLTTLERLAAQWPDPPAALWVPEELAALVAERHRTPVNVLPEGDVFLCVNGRFVYPAVKFDLRAGQALVEAGTGHVVAAALGAGPARHFLETGVLDDSIERLEHHGQLLAARPWDILTALPQTLMIDLLACEFPQTQPAGAVVLGDGPVLAHPSAVVQPGVVLDGSDGPIVIDEGAVVHAGAVLYGPCSIGAGSVVYNHALLRSNTVIGPVCKVNGEIGATIFQGYANKGHDGYLGDSWVGEWVNFGAGTTNSNLLNTYGEISMRVRPELPRERTGRQFLGVIAGDHVKTAICTRIMTGTSLGVGTMVATTAAPPPCTGPFAWLTDDGEPGATYRIDKFLEVARVVMSRRRVVLSEAMEAALRRLYLKAAGR